MAKNIWFISDHHLSHAKILTFKDKHDCLIRPEFETVEEMNSLILELHNQTVKPEDEVYFLGDVLWNKEEAWKTLGKMNGKLYLAPGNHDNVPDLVREGRFRDVRLWYRFTVEGKKLLACHTPLHEIDLIRCTINVHGHLHEKNMNDPRYINVCVEQLGYQPIHLEDLVALAGE